MKKEEIVALTEFDAWANARVLAAVEKLTPEEFTRDLGSSFGSVRDTLGHILAAEWAWVERLQGRSPAAMPSVKEDDDVASLRARWSVVENELREYLLAVTQAQLDEVTEYLTFSFGPMRSVRWQMIQHFVNHGTYHRGQVATMLRQLGGKSVGTDLIAFYRERSAAAAA